MNKQVERVQLELEQHQTEIIEHLGPTAFEMLTPREAADIIGVDTKRFPDLLREGWLVPVPNRKIGRGNLYYRWRAEFVKLHRRTRNKST